MNEPPVSKPLPPAPATTDETLTPVAGDGLLDRRAFLGATLATGAVSMARPTAAASDPEPWRYTPGAAFSNYGEPSVHERDVIRWVSATTGAPTNGISWCPLQDLDGIITPNGLHYERHHNGVPDIDPAAHRLVIHGEVQQALTFSIDALLRYPRESRIWVIECGGNSNAGWRRKPIQTAVGYFHGLVSCSEWTGVPLGLLLDEVGVKPDAAWAIAEGADAFGMTVSVPLAKLHHDALLALFQNGERIRPEQGYPVRLVVPGCEGVLNVKWLRTLKIARDPVMARNETSRYTELQPSGKARMFTFAMAVKSVITAPSAGMRLENPGYYEISGLAWSGRGRITRVEVSADGGETWAEAALNEPVLPCCFTRFRIPWQWDGGVAVLQSRASDEAGEVQPARADLLAARGRHGYFHYNAIVSWAVDPQGAVEHTYVDAEPDTAAGDPFDDDWDF
jgi:sulfane dehydrogenase subunit SoxC